MQELHDFEETLEKLSLKSRKGEDEQLQVKREIEEIKGDLTLCR